MGVKRVLPDYQLITNGVMTGTTTITSSSQNIVNFDNVGLQVSWTGTPVGSFSVNCSIDNVTFIPLSFSPPLTAPSGSAGNFLISLNQVPFSYVQVTYTNASGSGVLNVLISQKDIN